MNGGSQNILGCSLDGMKDRLWVAGEAHPRGERYAPAHVVLPLHQSGPLVTGCQAAAARISSGLGWPPEARVHPDGFVRRVPVSYAWRLLVDARDKALRWAVGEGVAFPLTKIVAAHIARQLAGLAQSPDAVILAIPNELDEFGQEGLLQDLKQQGLRNVQLVWRPIAAALAWLERTQHAWPKALPANDCILVVHLGPDCMEFVPFRLRERAYQGQRYIIPLREPPQVSVGLGGYDWGADLIESTVEPEEAGAFWQALTGFPEIWETLAHRGWNSDQLPRIWSRRDSWERWDPPANLCEHMWTREARLSVLLSELTRGSCRLTRQVPSYGSWLHLLHTHVRQAAELYGGQLRGMILSGPFASSLSSPWFAEMTSFFASKGLRASPSPEAVLDGIWVPGSTHDAVAEGAAIYGARLLAGAPSYLDTLPQLWTYAQARGKLDWVALLEAEEVEGGQKFARVLQQKFSLPRHAKTLQVFLRKGHEQIRKAAFHFPYVSEESMPLDTHIAMSPASGLAQIELVPIQTDFLRGQRVFLDYALMEDATEAELPKPQLGFPPLMKIQVDPEDRRLLSVVKTAWDTFRDIHIRGELHQYCTAVGKLKAIVTPQLSFPSAANSATRGRIVDQDGQAGTPQGQALIQHLAAKLGEDLRTLHHQPLVGTTEQRRSIVGDIRQAATWLFAGAPSEVIQYLKSELEKIHGEGSHQHLIEAASRALTDVDDLKLLYRAISRVITYRGCHPRPNQARFPINSVRALYNVMALRTSGPEAMTRPEAATFVAATLCTMEECVQANNYAQKFSHAAKLFLYLLRYRQVDQTFLVEVNVQDRQLFDRAIGCLESAQRFWQTKGNDLRAEKCTALMQEIKNYMVFQGSPDIIEILNAVDDLSGETDSDET